jgi:transcriptional regulator with XRE-family HTH domain
MTLREVEEASDKKVSNAYVSQIETGRIRNPSPAILQELSKVYEVRMPGNSPVSCSYERMMDLAGHLRPSEAPAEKSRNHVSFADEQLTPEEEAELLNYLAFIRTRNAKR